MDERFDEATLLRAKQLAKQLGKYPNAALYAIESYSYASITDLNVRAGVASVLTLFSKSKDASYRALIREAFNSARLRCDFDTFVRLAYSIFAGLYKEGEYRFKTEEQVHEMEEKEKEVLKSAKSMLADFLKALQKIADNPQGFFRSNQLGMAMAA